MPRFVILLEVSPNNAGWISADCILVMPSRQGIHARPGGGGRQQASRAREDLFIYIHTLQYLQCGASFLIRILVVGMVVMMMMMIMVMISLKQRTDAWSHIRTGSMCYFLCLT
jgi:hypothetical protein